MNLIERFISIISLLSLFVVGPALGRALLLRWNKNAQRSQSTQHIMLSAFTMIALTGLVVIYGAVWKANPRLVAWFTWVSPYLPITGDVDVTGSVDITNEPLKVEIDR